MSKHVMECVELDDGGSRVCLGCRQYVHGSLTETPPGECPKPYKSPKQLLDEALAREAALRDELAELREELSEEFDDEERTTETLQEAIVRIKKDRDDNKSRWLSASERLKLQGVTIRVGSDREKALRVQLHDATTSLGRLKGEQVGLTFKYQHPQTKENRTASLTKAEVADGMEDTLYEKLVAQFCQCESLGETNVVDCNCDEYIHDFDLVAGDAEVEQPAPIAVEPILTEAVAVTRECEEEGLRLEWLLEGGIAALELPGTVLFVAHGTVTNDNGHGYVIPVEGGSDE